jgi:hypothetical protein
MRRITTPFLEMDTEECYFDKRRASPFSEVYSILALFRSSNAVEAGLYFKTSCCSLFEKSSDYEASFMTTQAQPIVGWSLAG